MAREQASPTFSTRGHFANPGNCPRQRPAAQSHPAVRLQDCEYRRDHRRLQRRPYRGHSRLLVSDAGTLDRTLDQPRQQSHAPDLDAALAQARWQHAADRIYVSLLAPETQAGMEGQTLSSLPLSVANTLEPLRAAQDASLNGESAELEADAPAGGVLSGFQVLNLRIEPGGGLD